MQTFQTAPDSEDVAGESTPGGVDRFLVNHHSHPHGIADTHSTQHQTAAAMQNPATHTERCHAPANTAYAEAIAHFADQHLVTVAAGATCAYLGDERNLREFLIADETARWLRRAGHTVITFLVDDSMDALSYRQLRVGVSKDEKVLAPYLDWCGKPISSLPDPFGCHESYAAHFEDELLSRLHRLDCHPILVSTAKLYQKGVYAPFVRIVLERHEEIEQFIESRFPGYHMEKLFWPVCPDCGYMEGVDLEAIEKTTVRIACSRCRISKTISHDDVQGKLSWKLDCAARWVILGIGAEPFNKNYLEPLNGSFVVAQALSEKFFGGHPILPLHYGLVKMENKFGGKLLQSLPPKVLRQLLVENPAADLKLTRDLIITSASRHEALPDVSYLDYIKQILPLWMLTPAALTPEQRDLVSHGLAFREHFLQEESHCQLPSRRHFYSERPEVLSALHSLIVDVVELRQREDCSDDERKQEAKSLVGKVGVHKKKALQWLRAIIGQREGLPASRFLLVLPLEYLQMLEYMLELHLYLHNVNVETDAPVVERRDSDLRDSDRCDVTPLVTYVNPHDSTLRNLLSDDSISAAN